jgi:SAM-dependent methyltransferase
MHNKKVPLPPLELRGQVSPITDDAYYDNPTGDYIWGPLDIGPLKPGEAYRKILDFGCGCGREARRLLLQHDRPKVYVGLDINRPMIEWCRKNLAGNGFSFLHHDVWSVKYAPENSRNRYLPITHAGDEFTLIEANSVFTHLHDDQTRFYLQQMCGMLAPNGIIRATWFLFNKRSFPTMTDDLHTLLVSDARRVLRLGLFRADNPVDGIPHRRHQMVSHRRVPQHDHPGSGRGVPRSRRHRAARNFRGRILRAPSAAHEFAAAARAGAVCMMGRHVR